MQVGYLPLEKARSITVTKKPKRRQESRREVEEVDIARARTKKDRALEGYARAAFMLGVVSDFSKGEMLRLHNKLKASKDVEHPARGQYRIRKLVV